MSKPDPTPPKETSAAQTGTSVSTSIANAFLTNSNEYTPDGTKTFDQTGSYTFTDPYTNETYTVPRFSMTQTLSPQQQQIKSQQDAASMNLAQLGNNLSDQLGTQLTGNFDLGDFSLSAPSADGAAIESNLFDMGRKRLDPLISQRDEELRSRLANQGIKAGSSAYGRELNTFNQGANDAYTQLALAGRGQVANELLAQRSQSVQEQLAQRGMQTQERLTEDNQRINQISALLNGGQVSQPNFLTQNQVNPIPITDNASIISNYDQQRMEAAKMANAGLGSVLSGVGGLFAMSDERAKNKMKPVGKANGHTLYSYSYKGDGKRKRIGVSAQETAKKRPDAVLKGRDGMLRVNYDKIGLGALHDVGA